MHDRHPISRRIFLRVALSVTAQLPLISKDVVASQVQTHKAPSLRSEELREQETDINQQSEVIEVGDIVGVQSKLDQTTHDQGFTPDIFANVLSKRREVITDENGIEQKRVQFMFDQDGYNDLSQQVESFIQNGRLPEGTTVPQYLQLHIDQANMLLDEHDITSFNKVTLEPIYIVTGGYTGITEGPTRAESPDLDADEYEHNLPYLRKYYVHSISGGKEELHLPPSVSAFIPALGRQVVTPKDGEIIDANLVDRILSEIYGFTKGNPRVSFTTVSSTLNQQVTVRDGKTLPHAHILALRATDKYYYAKKGHPYLGYLGDGLQRVGDPDQGSEIHIGNANPTELHISVSIDTEPTHPDKYAKIHTIRGRDDRVTANQDNPGEVPTYGNRIYLQSQQLGQPEGEGITADAVYIEIEGETGNGIIPLPKTVLNSIIYEQLANNSRNTTIFLDFILTNGYTIEDLAHATSLAVNYYDEGNLPRTKNVCMIANISPERYVVVTDDRYYTFLQAIQQ